MGPIITSVQLADILSFRVCSRLRLADLQALSQTCKVLRQLVLEQVPTSAWKDLAQGALPAAHPWLALQGGETLQAIQRAARAKHTLSPPSSLGMLVLKCFFQREAKLSASGSQVNAAAICKRLALH